MIRIVGKRGKGKYEDQLDAAAKGVAFETVDVSSCCKDAVLREGLSPLCLGPVECYDDLVCRRFERAWQCAKVYPSMVGEDGNPNEAYYVWRDKQWAREDRASKDESEKKEQKSKIKGLGKPLYQWWKVNGEFRRLGYIEGRKLIYLPLYAKAVVKTEAYRKLCEMRDAGKNILLLDFDGYNIHHERFAKIGFSYNDVLNCPNLKMGHAFVLAMLLEGFIKVRNGKVTYEEGLLDERHRLYPTQLGRKCAGKRMKERKPHADEVKDELSYERGSKTKGSVRLYRTHTAIEKAERAEVEERSYAERSGWTYEEWHSFDEAERADIKAQLISAERKAASAARSAERKERAKKQEEYYATAANMTAEEWSALDVGERAELRERIKKEEKERAEQKRSAARLRSKPKKPTGKKPVIVDHANDKCGPTSRTLAEAMKHIAENMFAHSVVDEEDARNGESPFEGLRLKRKVGKDEQALLDRFDKMYRSHIYRRLLQPIEDGGLYGFSKVLVDGERIPMLGDLSGADVFTAVWAKLFGVRYESPKSGKQKKATLKSYFLDFDFSCENVGRGAFRAYLDAILYTTFHEMNRRDLVPLKDIHGKIMRDAKGKVIWIPRDQFEKDDCVRDNLLQQRAEHQVDKERQKRSRLLLELSYLAYYRLHADENVCPRWFRPFAEEIFEQGKDDKEVRPKALASTSVPSESAFNKELSCFRKKIRKLRDKLYEKMYAFETCKAPTAEGVHVMGPKEVLEREWDELALWVGDRRMHDIRYNIVRGIMDV